MGQEQDLQAGDGLGASQDPVRMEAGGRSSLAWPEGVLMKAHEGLQHGISLTERIGRSVVPIIIATMPPTSILY